MFDLSTLFLTMMSQSGTLTGFSRDTHRIHKLVNNVFNGSTKFGDTIDDTHEVAVSMTMSGSVTVNDGNLK